MSWILTATGRAFDLANPVPAQVDIMDMAWSFGQQVRFTGHCLRPLSVAEHCLLVAEICEREFHFDAEGLMGALLHEPEEPYMGDANSPLKALLGDAWYALARRHKHAVALAFDLRVTLEQRRLIKCADNIALATEKRDLMPSHGAGELPWPCLRGVEPCSWIDLRSPELAGHNWEFWRDRFLDRYHELDFARQLQREGCSRHEPAPVGG